MADVTMTVTATQAVTMTIEAVIINQTMIVNFEDVSDTLTSDYFVNKTLDDIVLIANGTDLITSEQATKASTASNVITITDLGGTGLVKAIISSAV